MTYHITRQQHANLLEARDVMWPSVPPENVAWGLARWYQGPWGDKGPEAPNCGTVACFGGWCAWWPAFRAQGVWAGTCGEPRRGDLVAYPLADRLFGCYGLFSGRGGWRDDGFPGGTDHELVTWRLNQVLNDCVVIDDTV